MTISRSFSRVGFARSGASCWLCLAILIGAATAAFAQERRSSSAPGVPGEQYSQPLAEAYRVQDSDRQRRRPMLPRPSVALESGYYHISFRGFDDHAASIAPIVNLSAERFSLTVKYLYSRYTLGSSDVDKHDIDSSLTLFPHRLFGFFVGFRGEIQEVRVDGGGQGEERFGFNVYALPIGTTASINVPGTDFYLFGVGTIFAYTFVSQRAPRGDVEGFGGYGLAAGVARPLEGVLGLPVSLKAGYRFQDLEVGDFHEEVDQVNLGIAWHF